MKKKVISIGFIILLIVLSIYIIVRFMPFFLSLKDETIRNEYVEKYQNLKILGVFMFLGLQILQVIIAFFPGEIIEVMSGIIYGPIFGLIVCEIGIFIASSIIFLLVKVLGKGFVDRNVSEKQYKKLSFLNDEKKLSILVFYALMLPMTPKDALLYVVPLTKIKYPKFMVINLIARIPSILTSTFVGQQLLEGELIWTIVIYGITFIISIIFIIFKENILKIIFKIKNLFTKK